MINQIMANPQGPYFDREGATGMIAMLYFSADGKEVEVRYISSVRNEYFVSNYNPVEGKYAIDTSCFKMSVDSMDEAVPVTLKTSQKPPEDSNEDSENNSGLIDVEYEDDGRNINLYLGIGIAAATVAVVVVAALKKKH